jgi:carbon-monoxide dehydrogenase small subunit
MQRDLAVSLTVNGARVDGRVSARTLLADFLREQVELTGVRVSCEHGVCGACTILVDGKTARACLMLAVQADGCELVTVEGLGRDGELHPLQRAFWDQHGLQCGWCTPGMLMTAWELLRANAAPTEAEVREAIAGNVCRCTGYVHIVRAILAAAEAMRGAPR